MRPPSRPHDFAFSRCATAVATSRVSRTDLAQFIDINAAHGETAAFASASADSSSSMDKKPFTGSTPPCQSQCSMTSCAPDQSNCKSSFNDLASEAAEEFTPAIRASVVCLEGPEWNSTTLHEPAPQEAVNRVTASRTRSAMRIAAARPCSSSLARPKWTLSSNPAMVAVIVVTTYDQRPTPNSANVPNNHRSSLACDMLKSPERETASSSPVQLGNAARPE
mmetsp:Transcript_15050/g.41408  ORF Transcript_15050/g.41408 Transcript_15050/m.41408 type:complete len:222 (+) Transcript_15050:735-1400(+)